MKGPSTILLVGMLGLFVAVFSHANAPGPSGTVASETDFDPMEGMADMEQRHAEFGVQCSDCHGAAMSVPVPTMEQCAACHGSYSDLAALTDDMIPNPHDSHMGEEACGQCHREHEESRLSCNDCHIFDMDVP